MGSTKILSGKKNNRFIRHNKNFLDHPMFAIDEIDANQENHCWSPVEGYRLETGYKLPTKTDQVVLYFLMLRSQELGWRSELFFTKHEILKNCGIYPNDKSYDRLDDTLKRWLKIDIFFDNSFLCAEKGKAYKVSGGFHILDSYKFEKQIPTGKTKILIQLNRMWLDLVRTHAFFEMLDFRAVRQLTSPLCLRLFEILSKNFYKRDTWKIDSSKLAAMIPLKVTYASECEGKIKPMITRINKACGGKVYSLEISKPARGVAIFSFRKDEKAMCLPPVQPFPGPPAPVPGIASGVQNIPLPLLFPEKPEDAFDPMIFFNSLPKRKQEKLLTEFKTSLNAYNLKRYKSKGLDGVKVAFAKFCEEYV